MGAQKPVFLRKDALLPADSVKNPVSLSECVSPVMANSRHVLAFLNLFNRTLNFLWVCLSISPSIR